MRLNKDLLNNADPAVVANSTYKLVDLLQEYPPHLQTAASAVLFMTVAELWRQPPQEVFTVIRNIVHDPIQGELPEFRALRLYAENELS